MAELLEVAANHAVANVTVTTTTEEVAITSPAILVPTSQASAIVFGHAQLTTGAGTTAVTPRVRRGTAITDTLVGEATAIEVAAAAGSDEMFDLLLIDSLDDVDSVQYAFTLQQAGASGNGAILQAAILVLLT